jgi:plasmid stability protein
MPNLTIALDDKLIKLARVKAIQQGTSVSAKIREYLVTYVADSEDAEVLKRKEQTAELFLLMDNALSDTKLAAVAQSSTSANIQKRKTLRDEIYKDNFRALDRLKP